MFDANTATIHGAAFRAEIDSKLLKALAAEPVTANTKELYSAFSHVARDQLARRWVKTQAEDRKNKSRRIYYLSMEFLSAAPWTMRSRRSISVTRRMLRSRPQAVHR